MLSWLSLRVSEVPVFCATVYSACDNLIFVGIVFTSIKIPVESNIAALVVYKWVSIETININFI